MNPHLSKVSQQAFGQLAIAIVVIHDCILGWVGVVDNSAAVAAATAALSWIIFSVFLEKHIRSLPPSALRLSNENYSFLAAALHIWQQKKQDKANLATRVGRVFDEKKLVHREEEVKRFANPAGDVLGQIFLEMLALSWHTWFLTLSEESVDPIAVYRTEELYQEFCIQSRQYVERLLTEESHDRRDTLRWLVEAVDRHSKKETLAVESIQQIFNGLMSVGYYNDDTNEVIDDHLTTCTKIDEIMGFNFPALMIDELLENLVSKPKSALHAFDWIGLWKVVKTDERLYERMALNADDVEIYLENFNICVTRRGAQLKEFLQMILPLELGDAIISLVIPFEPKLVPIL